MSDKIVVTRADNGWLLEYCGGMVVEQGNVAEIHGVNERGHWEVRAIFTPTSEAPTE